jgi:peptide/nickel transport system substrate-binding protein
MIPADAPPSVDAHSETTFATIHPAAPFYSVLIRVNSETGSRQQISCVPLHRRPKPTDDSKTYAFKE